MNFKWPSGKFKCVIMLHKSAKDFFTENNIDYKYEKDDLDFYYWSVINVSPIGFVYFEEHINQPEPGVAICVDSLINTDIAIKIVKEHFRIIDKDINWIKD